MVKVAILKACGMPWPPTGTYLQGTENSVPDSLQKFLWILISGTSSLTSSETTERLVSSLGQDIRRGVTGKWKLPKHILVCMTHLFRNAQVNTLINKLGMLKVILILLI